VNWQLVVQKTRVIKKCFRFSSEGGERRCSPYSDGRLFHARRVATENDQSPRVDRLTSGTIRVAVADEGR